MSASASAIASAVSLPRVVGERDGAGDLGLVVLRLRSEIVELRHPVLPKLVAKAGEIEPAQQVLGVEGGDAYGHAAS
jgi:hypothetical protein